MNDVFFIITINFNILVKIFHVNPNPLYCCTTSDCHNIIPWQEMHQFVLLKSRIRILEAGYLGCGGGGGGGGGCVNNTLTLETVSFPWLFDVI